MHISRALAPSLVAAFSLFCATPASAQHAPAPDANGQPISLPNVDVRLAPDRPTGAVMQAVVDARDTAKRTARLADLARLERAVPGVFVQEHELFGTPRYVRSTSHLLTEPAPGVERSLVVRDFVEAFPGLFEVSVEEIDRARMARDYLTRHNGVRHFTFQQQLAGIDIFGAELKANVTRDGALINVASSLLPRPEGDFAPPAGVLDAGAALRTAAADAGIALTQALQAETGPAGADALQRWVATQDFRRDVPITTQQIWFPVTRTEIHPAWRVVVPVPGIGNTYETIVDATDGTILHRWNQLHFLGGTQDITFNVWTDDSPAPLSPGLSTPTGFQAPVVPRTLVTVTGAENLDASPDGWIDDGGTETFGNNVDAATDTNADNFPDLPRPNGGAGRLFDFPIDLATQSPSQYRDHAATQLFYYSNRYHDALWRLGWDEAASNLQDDNFGRGGVGGDRLSADAQDGSSVNNARFLGSGFDGSSARIEQFVFDGPSPDRDGSLDGDVVYHEISHGLSIRLSGGTVGGEQSGGMGEGWGDYFGVSLNAQPTDDPNGPWAMGGYITQNLFGVNDNYYFGIRRYPYGTDLGISPLTYADADPAQIVIPGGIPANPNFIGNPADGVHNVGEIWCNALLGCRAELWAVQGFAANELMMQLVVDGLKLMPSNPSLVEARDAILQADLVNNGGANLGELWAGFAHRGLGGSAFSPPGGSSTTGIVEAFDEPPLVVISYPSGQPDQLLPGSPTTFQLGITALGSTTISPATETLRLSVNGAPASSIALANLGGGDYSATIPALDCFDNASYWIEVGTNGGPITDPPSAPGQTFVADVFTSVDMVFNDDFEADLGWSVGAPGDDATTGIWERVDPIGTAAQPEDDASDPSTIAFVTGQGSPGGGLGENDVDGGQTTLTSPTLDLSGGDAVISYERWYSNDTSATPNTDIFVIDVTNNGGGSWTNVETIGPAGPGTSGGWIHHEFTVSDFVTPTANVQVRFIASDEGDGSLVEAGIDDFDVFRLECGAVCQTDLGFGGPGDLSLSICGALGTGDVATLEVQNAGAFETVYHFLGFANAPVPFKGGTLVPGTFSAIVRVNANASGSLSVPVPGGGGPFSLFVQAAALDGSSPSGVELSNAVQAEFLP